MRKVSGCVGVLQHAVDDDVVLGEERAPAAPGPPRGARRGSRPLGVVVEVHDPRRVDRRADRGDAAVGQDLDVVDAVRVQRGDGAAGGGAEADDDGPQPAAVVAGRAGSSRACSTEQ